MSFPASRVNVQFMEPSLLFHLFWCRWKWFLVKSPVLPMASVSCIEVKQEGHSLCCDHTWPIFQLTWRRDHNAEGLRQTRRSSFRCHKLVPNFLMETKSVSILLKINGRSSKLRLIFNTHLIQMRWNNWEQRSSCVSTQSEHHHWLWLNHQLLWRSCLLKVIKYFCSLSDNNIDLKYLECSWNTDSSLSRV